MKKEVVELIIRIGIELGRWITDTLKAKKGESRNDRQGTSKTQ
jgi:hypothetical protein